MRKHLNIKIFGLVQGVSFRYYSQDKARELGIGGLVRNDRDGSLYIEVEGEGEDLKKFVEWCRQGPGSARVERVEVEEGEVCDYQEFRIEL